MGNGPVKSEPIVKIKTAFELQQERNDIALDALISNIPDGPWKTEEMPIEQATGRILASELTATIDEPPYSKATANGFLFLPWGTALASSKRPLTFEVIGDMPDPSKPIELPTGKALRVKKDDYMSIRRFLEGNYAVLPESDQTREQNGRILVTRFIEKHENILVQGSVWKNGNIIFEKGHRIRTRDIFLLASQGILKVSVGFPPTVALFSCGDELLSPTEPYRIGHKYDCNAYGLSALTHDAGGLPRFCGIMPNQLNPAMKKLSEVLGKEDIHIVVISGGVSEREKRFTVDLLRTAGITGEKNSEEIAEALKWAVLAAEEIHPCVLGILKGKPIVCLPGDPKAAARSFRTFAWPVIGRLLGEKKRADQTEEEEF